MNKRGQVTIFVILGIVIVATIVLLFAFRKDILPTPGQAGIAGEVKQVKRIINDCLGDVSKEPIEKIARQGGYLSPGQDTFRLWNDTPISYLCFNQMEKETCTNRLLTLRKMEDQLSETIAENMKNCVDFSTIRRAEVSENKDFNVKVQIAPLQVLIDLDYPVKIKSDENEASLRKFSHIVDAPLGDLYEVSQDILDQETSVGAFDQLSYMLLKLGKYTIYVQKPYPDKIYRLKLRENDFTFQFAVQGEPS